MNCLLIYGAHLCRSRAKITFGEAKGLYKTCRCTEKGQVCGNKSICYIILLLETGSILFQYIPTLLVWHTVVLNTSDSFLTLTTWSLSYRIVLSDQPVNMKKFDVMELEIDELDDDIVSAFSGDLFLLQQSLPLALDSY